METVNLLGVGVCAVAAGEMITVEKTSANGFFIYPKLSETCEHPRDYIYMPWGYSPWIDTAPITHRATSLLPLCVALLTVIVISRF